MAAGSGPGASGAGEKEERCLEDEALRERFLVLRAQTGSREAVTGLVERYDARLLFYLRRLLDSPADAEDVRQEVWLSVVRKLRTLEDPGAFRTWLYTIARHRALSWIRGRRREVPIEEADLEERAVEAEEDEAEFSPEDAGALRAAIDRLPPPQREVLCLRFLSGLGYAEIARVVACRVGTVRSRLHYAKAALRESLGRSRGGG